MKTAVHFGAGNIGRGLLGPLLNESNYHITFVDTNQDLVNKLNESDEYIVNYWGPAQKKKQIINNFHAISDVDLIIEEIKKTNLVTTAVGPNVLPLIAKTIAMSIEKRIEIESPLNIIACENKEYGSSSLREYVYEHLSENAQNYSNKWVSFPNAAIDRIIPNQNSKDGLSLMVEDYYELIVVENEIKHQIPQIKNMTLVKDLAPFIERKLFVVNNAHASTGYYAKHLGYEYMNEALKDSRVKEFLFNLIKEVVTALKEKEEIDSDIITKYGEQTYNRFIYNPVQDEISRISRNPITKLGENERILRPTKLYIQTKSKIPNYLTTAIACGFLYHDQKNDESVKLQKLIEDRGIEVVISEVTGLPKESELYQIILSKYKKERNIDGA